ncbi:MAG: hypothetical protein EOO76_08790 [Novosphingobium sp.]|nr:MAG: hypothetical protein EOO76_08790 [Novosphingobium sp.]
MALPDTTEPVTVPFSPTGRVVLTGRIRLSTVKLLEPVKLALLPSGRKSIVPPVVATSVGTQLITAVALLTVIVAGAPPGLLTVASPASTV